jgi:signal transduction histidine kinase
LANSPQEIVINVIIFIIVLLFGVLLIRSVIREVKQKEQMEKLAKEIKVAYEVEKNAHLVEKKAREELETLDMAKDQFLLAIEHHLRTPLTAMLGYSDLLLNGTVGKQPKKVTDIVEKFQTSTKSLIKMANDFLDVTQFQLGKEVISLTSGVDVVLIINEIMSDLKFQVEKKKIYLKLEKPNDTFEISADREKLKAGLYNLIDNAVKYTADGGVTVKMENDTKNIRIIVKDTGIGIAPENIKNIFGKTFERGNEAKKVFTSGRGIGVYIAGQIVKAHKGTIKVESEGEGKGSTFYVDLPRV